MDPNIDMTASKGPTCLTVVITFTTLAALAVVSRLYTRLSIIKNASLDDALVSIAWLFSLATTIGTIAEVNSGMGKHIMALKPADIVGVFKALYATILVYNFGLVFAKLSILSQYLRICASQRMRFVCWATIVFVIAYGVETFLTGLLTCTPIAFYWDTTIQGGKCLAKSPLYFANGGINIFSDFLIFTLPFFLLKGLMVPMRQKCILIGVLALGSCACIASVFRVTLLYRLSTSQDPTWDNSPVAYWSSIEINVAIICSSISTLRPLLARVIPSIFASQARQGQYIKYLDPDRALRLRLQRDSANGKFDLINRSGQASPQQDYGFSVNVTGAVDTGSRNDSFRTGTHGV